MSRRCLLQLLLVASTLCSTSAFAGVLRVVVVDTEGEPVAGATVTQSRHRMQRKAHLQTPASGTVAFDVLAPVTMRVQATLHSQTSSPIDVDVHPDRESVVRLVLGETPVVTNDEDPPLRSSARVIDTTALAGGGVVALDARERLATFRTVQNLARLSPQVVDSSLSPGGLSIAGGSPFGNQVFLDGVRITDPVDGTFALPVNFDAISQLRLLSSGLDAEHGFVHGGRIDVSTVQGTDEFHVDGSVWYAPEELALVEGDADAVSSQASANLLVTGPIQPGKLWFHVSAHLQDRNAAMPFNPESFQGVGVEPSERTVHLLGKLMWRPTAWQRLSFYVSGDPQWAASILQDDLVDDAAERQQFSGGMASGLTSHTRLLDGLWWTTTIGYRANRLELFPQSGRTDIPAHVDTSTGRVTDNDLLHTDDLRHRLELDSSVTYRAPDFFGRHLVKFGVEAMAHWNLFQIQRTGGQTYYDGADGTPLTLHVAQNPGPQLVWGNQGAMFVQDRYQPFESFTVRAGLRLDSARAYTEDNLELFNFNSLSPRIGVAWDPFNDGTIVLRTGYFHYVDTGRLDAARQVGRGLVDNVYAYNPATSEYDVFVEQRTSGRPSTFMPGMQPPGIHELVIGGRFVAFDDAVFGADGIFRRRERSFEDAGSNLLWNADGTDVIAFSDGGSSPVFEFGTFDEAYADYLAAVFLFEKRVADDWSLMANYTFSALTGTSEGFASTALDNARQAPFAYGPLADDIRHNAQLHATYDFPLGVSVGMSLLYTSGRPISKLHYNAAFDDYTDLRAPRGIDPQDPNDPTDDVDLRLPDQMTANLRLRWSLQELTEQDILLTVDVFNLFHQRAILEVEQRDLPVTAETRFLEPLKIAPPLRAQVSLRYRF